jgi:hypothetical protein
LPEALAEVERLTNLTKAESDEIEALKEQLEVAYHERDVAQAALSQQPVPGEKA